MSAFAIQKKSYSDAWERVGLMAVCLVALTLGNCLFHTGWITVDASSFNLFLETFSLDDSPSFSSFLWSVILHSRKDIFCVLLISCARFVKFPRTFISLLFFVRSTLLGFCGAFFIGGVGKDISLWSGFLAWMLFFGYHTLFFAVMICFGTHTLSLCREPFSWRKDAGYWLTVCGEISLVILSNMVYCFLISKF